MQYLIEENEPPLGYQITYLHDYMFINWQQKQGFHLT